MSKLGVSVPRIRLLVGVATILLTAVSSVHGATREVGSGQTFATIQACLNAAVAGDICNVHAGTYTEQLILQRSGTLANLITLRNNPGDVVTVQSAATPVVNINGMSYWTFDGINVTYNGSAVNPRGIQNLHGAAIDYVTVKNLTITIAGGSGTDGYGLMLCDSDHATVTNLTIAITASSGAGVGINGAAVSFASNLEFSGNTVYGNASESTGKLQDGIAFTGTNLNIENNLVHDGWAFDRHPDGIVIQGDGDRNGNYTANVRVVRNTVYNFSQGIYFDAIHNPILGANLIANNVVYELANYRYGGAANKMNGIVIDGESLSGPYWPIVVKIYNNTVASRQVLIYSARLGSGSLVEWKNNILLNPGYQGAYHSSTDGVVVDYNYYSPGDGTPIGWGATPYSLATFKAAGLGEANSASGAVNLNANYTENADSSSRGRGVNLTSFFTVDRVGATRPPSGAWDMGAYQFGSSGAPPAPPANVILQ